MIKMEILLKVNKFYLLILIIIHLVHIFILFYKNNLALTIIPELLFFIIVNKFIFNKKLTKILLSSFNFLLILTAVFLINLFSYEGKILYEVFLFKITETGLDKAINNLSVLLILYIFTNINIQYIKQKLDFTNNQNENLIIKSVKTFFYFFDDFNKKYFIKSILKKTILFKRSNYTINYKEHLKSIIPNYNKSIVVYNLVLIVIYIGLICFYR